MNISWGELVFAFACVAYTGWHIGIAGVVFVDDPAMFTLGMCLVAYGLFQVWECIWCWWKTTRGKKPD